MTTHASRSDQFITACSATKRYAWHGRKYSSMAIVEQYRCLRSKCLPMVSRYVQNGRLTFWLIYLIQDTLGNTKYIFFKSSGFDQILMFCQIKYACGGPKRKLFLVLKRWRWDFLTFPWNTIEPKKHIAKYFDLHTFCLQKKPHTGKGYMLPDWRDF